MAGGLCYVEAMYCDIDPKGCPIDGVYCQPECGQCRECSDEAVKTVGPACGKCLVCLMYMDDSIAPWDV